MARRTRAVPAGTVLEKFRADLEKPWPAGVTLITGEDAWYRDRAERALIRRLCPDADSGGDDSMSTRVIAEGKHEVGQIVSAARSVGMFSPIRVVWVHDAAFLEGEPAPLVEYSERPPDGSYVVIKGGKLDMRRKLHKALTQVGRHYNFAESAPFDSGKLNDIRALAAQHGVEIDREAVSFLSAACLGDMYRVEREIEKMSTWMGDRDVRRITVDDLREVIRGSDLLSGWELADAFADRDLKRALASVRRLASAGEEPIRLVGGLAWRARQMLAARARIAGGMPEARALQDAYGQQKETLRRSIGRYRMEEVLAFPAALSHADRCLKSRSLKGSTVLETLMQTLIEE
ncbi:MAG: DNA polymerase III subunit delta [Acidobacteriota bacterium]|nr:DNA polymerase III subunit delta [Acidobacteriota bacterium]